MAETKTKAMAEKPTNSKRKFRDVESNFVIVDDQDEPNHQTEVEGALIDVSSQIFTAGDGRQQPVGRYKLQTDDGKIWTVLGSTSLDDKMRSVAIGAYVRIEFDGMTKTANKRMVKQYKVQVAE